MELATFLHDWLSHPEWWFDPTHQYDTLILSRYGHLLNLPPENTLASLIVHDQLARHKYRNSPSAINRHLEIALTIHYNIDPTALSPQEWTFYALPVRHSNNPQAIFKILQQAWKLPPSPPLNNFLKATYDRLPLDQTPFLEINLPTLIESTPTSFIEYSHILAHTPLHQHPDRNSSLYHLFKTFLQEHNITELIISLSGGVDSQVCSYILTSLQHSLPFKLIALYINYNNRSIQEYFFVRDWCNSLNLPLYVRHITEIKRNPCMERNLRATYEDYTRNVRYHSYKAAWQLSHMTTPTPQVLLGHNKDDTFENILTNLAHKNHYDNLYGMSPLQTIDSITFLRPLLSIDKADLYHYANTYGIPHLADSTPSWSQRGQIRDIVKPALNQWEPSFVPSLFHLANRLSEHTLLIEEIIAPFQLPSFILPDKPLYFTQLFWEALFKKFSLPCSYKSLQNFLSSLKTKKSRSINLNKHTTFHLQNQLHVTIVTLPKT